MSSRMNEILDPEKTKFWRKKLKLDTPLALIFLIIGAGSALASIFYVNDLETYILDYLFLNDVINLIIIYFFLFLGARILKKFMELDIFSKDFFNSKGKQGDPEYEPQQTVFNSFILEVKKFENNKTEKFLPPLAGLCFAIPSVVIPLFNFQGSISPIDYVILMILGVIGAISIFFLILIPLSTLVIMVRIYSLINQLGTKKYPLRIEYTDLKTGKFEKIGIFIISFTIPTILLGTIMGIIGLFYVLILKSFISGYLYIIMGLLIAILMAFLLYKCTVNIHKAISKQKEELLEKAAIDLQNEYLHGDSDPSKRYETLYNMNNFYLTIESINDWPFNPTSYRKLFITLGSSLLPLFLSFLGLA